MGEKHDPNKDKKREGEGGVSQDFKETVARFLQDNPPPSSVQEIKNPPPVVGGLDTLGIEEGEWVGFNPNDTDEEGEPIIPIN